MTPSGSCSRRNLTASSAPETRRKGRADEQGAPRASGAPCLNRKFRNCTIPALETRNWKPQIGLRSPYDECNLRFRNFGFPMQELCSFEMSLVHEVGRFL